MKKMIVAAVLAVPLLTSSVRADGCCAPGPGCQVCTPCVRICIPSFCMKVWCNGCPPCGSPCGYGGGGGGGCCSLFGCPKDCGWGGNVHGPVGPWYLYWPLEAHFNVPAPCAYPFWPPGQTLPNGQTAAIPPPLGGPAPPPASTIPVPALNVPPPGPVGLPPGVAPKPDAFKPVNFHAPAVQPVLYSAPVPSYWYGR